MTKLRFNRWCTMTLSDMCSIKLDQAPLYHSSSDLDLRKEFSTSHYRLNINFWHQYCIPYILHRLWTRFRITIKMLFAFPKIQRFKLYILQGIVKVELSRPTEYCSTPHQTSLQGVRSYFATVSIRKSEIGENVTSYYIMYSDPTDNDKLNG